MLKILLQIILTFALIFSFTACGGSGGGGGDVTSPAVATLEDSTASVDENATEGTVVGTLNITNTGDSEIISITLSGVGSENFHVSTTGEITVAPGVTLDIETTTTYFLTAIATNAAGDSVSVDVNITITVADDTTPIPENTTPTLEDSTASVDENATEGTVVGTINITNTGDSEITSIILSGVGSENFQVSTTGDITVATGATLDIETTTTYFLTAIATNAAGDSVSVDVNITITVADDTTPIPENSTPILADSTGTIAENPLLGTAVGSVTIVTVGDSAITAISLSGPGNENFQVSTNGLISVALGALLDYETTVLYTLSAIATNSGGDSASVDVNITVTNVADVIPILANSIGNIAENAQEGTVVGTVTITDIGDSAISVIALNGVGSSNFQVSTVGIITVASGAILDYETTTSYALGVVAVNGAGASASVDVNITVADIENIFQTDKIQALDAELSDNFGYSVSTDGNYVVVGANAEDTSAIGAGSVYVYKKQTDGSLLQIAKIQASDPQSSDGFGNAVSISGDYIVVGAQGEDTDGSSAGSAYVFKRNSDTNISEIAKIQAIDADTNDYFGSSVSIDGDYIVVGAYLGDSNTTDNTGCAYIFKRNSDSNVSQILKIQAKDAEASDNFGGAVSIDGNYIVVGASYEDDNGFNAGSAYLFKRNSDTNVSQIAKLYAEDAKVTAQFGWSVSIDGDYIVVGANGKDITVLNEGGAYVFKRNSDTNVSQIAILQADDPTGYDYFGQSVSISGDYIAVGSYWEDTAGTNAGSTYIFKRNADDNVTQELIIQAYDAQNEDYFGRSVSINGNNIIVGAYNEDTTATNAGSAYLFDLEAMQKPYIYNALTSAISYNEQFFNTVVYSFDAASSIGGAITYSVSGTDASSFSFIDNNLSYISTADFEFPSDVGVDNDYNISVIATDINNSSTSVDIAVSINDKYYFDLAKIDSSNSAYGDLFGDSLSVSGEYIMVGASSEDVNGTDAGAAYLFKRDLATDTVTEIARVTSGDVKLGDKFGTAVAMSGEYFVVGATGEDTNGTSAGGVYLFKRDATTDEITQLARLYADDAVAYDKFGSSVSIDGDYIVVSARDKSTSSGGVYVFKRNSDTNVTQIGKLQAPTPTNYYYFGFSISVSGKYIVVGDVKESVFVYKIDSSDSVYNIQTLHASDQTLGDRFGYSVSISGEYIAVGASMGDTNIINNTGSAYVFKIDTTNDNVSQIAKVVADDAEYYDWFGEHISISGDYIVVGAHLEDTTDYNAGSAYIFKLDTLTYDVAQVIKIQASDASVNNYFGSAVSIDEDKVVVGTGSAAYVFIKDANQVE